MANEKVLLEVDSRRRISLGSLAAYNRYFAAVEEDGTIVLTPAVVMPAMEAEQLKVGALVDGFLDDPSTGSRRSRPVRSG